MPPVTQSPCECSDCSQAGFGSLLAEIVLATRVVLAASASLYSRVFSLPPGASVVMQVTALNVTGGGGVKAEFQASSSPGGTFLAIGPSFITVAGIGETQSINLGVCGFAFVRARFFSPASGLAVFSSTAHIYQLQA